MVQLLSQLPVGAKVKDTNTKYNGAVITWLVGGHNHYRDASTALVSEKILSIKPFDAKEPLNSGSRKTYGNNRYRYSNIRLWLNSEGASWYTPQHDADAPPNNANVNGNYNEYEDEVGFLTNFSAGLKQSLFAGAITTSLHSADGGGIETFYDKVFLPSLSEVGPYTNGSITEGKKLELFTSAGSSRVAYLTAEAVAQSENKNSYYKAGGVCDYWLRSPYLDATNDAVRRVQDIGTVSDSTAFSLSGIRPIINIKSAIYVSDTPGSDGAYTIVWNSTPTVTTIPDQSTKIGANKTITLSTYFKDADGDALTYTASSSATTVATVSIASGTLTIKPVKVGTATITIKATDPSGANVSTTFTITVSNSTPTVTTIPDQSSVVGSNKTLSLPTYFKDADGDVLTYTASSTTTSVVIVSISGGTLTLVPKTVGASKITVTAKDSNSASVSTTFNFIVSNSGPSVTLTQPTNSQTLYENSVYAIAGNATDADNGNIVNIRYSINDGTARALATGISDGNAAIPFAKTLTFRNGKLFDGETAITTKLVEGTAHMLRVWATDDQGATSTIISRSFYAVPNRAPVLTIDTPQPAGTINSDKFTISGTASDIDGNDVVVTYRINSGLAKEIYRGQGAPFSFEVSLKELAVGSNDIIVEVSDTYAFKATKTVRIRKNEVKTPVTQGTVRYRLSPPKGSAKGLVVWVQREQDVEVSASVSAQLAGEQEAYVTMTKTNTAPVSDGIFEDEFIFEADEAKTDIVIKFELNGSGAIKLITGAID